MNHIPPFAAVVAEAAKNKRLLSHCLRHAQRSRSPSCLVVVTSSPILVQFQPRQPCSTLKRCYSASTDHRPSSITASNDNNKNANVNNKNNTNVQKWQDWFTGIEYENPWLGFKTLDDVVMDKSSRYLIQNLQDLYHGIPTTYDRPTTERCNKVINDLLNCALYDKSTERNNVAVEPYAFRADAILQCMQLFANIDPTITKDEEDVSVSTIAHQRRQRLPYPLPHPDRTTYVSVLTLLSKTKQLAAKKGPLRCLDIVNQMKDFAMRMGDVTLQSIAHDYNKVLLAWGTSVSVEKAMSAAALLRQMKREGVYDDQSYNHVLRACAFSKFDNNVRAQQVGGIVAVQVYEDMVQNDAVECTPLTYSYFLRACAFLTNDEEREKHVEAAFVKCCNEGNVDDTVVLRLRQVASPQLWNKLMGEEGLAEQERIAIRDLPTQWTTKAKSQPQPQSPVDHKSVGGSW